ncbi:hypothetical protein F5877DRAFT_84108 [Lentinula edodes]|nr:hypothetical protein F5877DRAFT_84108 [Lentinula edodes]
MSVVLLLLLYLRRVRRYVRVRPWLRWVEHKIFIGAAITSTKFLDENPWTNLNWMLSTGGLFNIYDINQIEQEFLIMLNWQLWFTPEEIMTNCCELVDVVPELLGSSLLRRNNPMHQIPLYTLPMPAIPSFADFKVDAEEFNDWIVFG